MKISATFALGLFLALDILAMSVSCEEMKQQNLESQRGQSAAPAQSAAAGEGQACRDQIVHCYANNDNHSTCPYPGQKIEVSQKDSGCNGTVICICRCPVIPIPKTDSQ